LSANFKPKTIAAAYRAVPRFHGWNLRREEDGEGKRMKRVRKRRKGEEEREGRKSGGV